MAKRATLTDFAAKKPAAEPAPATAPEAAGKPPAGARRGQTIRLSVAAWHQLKLLALDKRATSHALLIEAVNDLFRKNDKPPIA